MFEQTHLVVIGLGGIGSHLLPPLMRFIASDIEHAPETITLVDGDKYDVGNSKRQDFPASLAGMNKADVQVKKYATIYPQLADRLQAFPAFVGLDNANFLVNEHCIVLLCVDNHVCRRIVSKRCQQLNDVLLISGGNELTDGNVQVYLKEEGNVPFPALEERHPEIGSTDDGDRSEMSCEELAGLPGGGQVIFANLFAASLMLQLLYATMLGQEDTCEIYFDCHQARTRNVPVPRQEG